MYDIKKNSTEQHFVFNQVTFALSILLCTHNKLKMFMFPYKIDIRCDQ